MKKHRALMATIGLIVTQLTGGTMEAAAEGTTLKGLSQPPLNTTMMGVLKAAVDYHDVKLEVPMVFGLSGHAFLINIHTELCPSGPYCWKRKNAEPLIENMGLRMTDLGFFDATATKEARADVERKLREALDKGIPCSLINLENQIIRGYDDVKLLSVHPWPKHNRFPPATLSFGSWTEFGKKFHVNFYTIEKGQPADRLAAIVASLDYAVDLWKNPEKHSLEGYGVGPDAYDNWIAIVPTAGSAHGNWWNASVWSECRRMAADYVTVIGNENGTANDLCTQLRGDYLKIAENLKKASNRKMDPEEKIALLKETKAIEASTINKVETLADTLRALGSRRDVCP